MNKGRVCILMMDSLGIGASKDAIHYGDEKSNTLGHILMRYPDLKLPNLTRWGLLHALEASSGMPAPNSQPICAYGYGVEQSKGKDTPSGHWELMGLPVLFDWGYFPNQIPCFPEPLIQAFLKKTGLKQILGNCHASGTTIIEELGEAHIKTGFPIVYTSADSVLQIACHEVHFGLERLYEICEIARKLVDDYQVGRVIARPFIGGPGHYERTANRRDYTTPPFKPTLLDKLKNLGHEVISVGKISDIFAHSGITQQVYADDNYALFNETMRIMEDAKPLTLVFTNFVDFDSKYGHRRDTLGYAKALESFDKQLALFEKQLQPNDVVFIVADHGCDTTIDGSDHTREHIPILMKRCGYPGRAIGERATFADVGQTIADFYGMVPLDVGTSFLAESP